MWIGGQLGKEESLAERVWELLRTVWSAPGPGWVVISALIGVLATKSLDWIQRRKQLRAARRSLAVLVIEEFVHIREILDRKSEFGGLERLLSFDVMVQRGGFEQLDFAVVTRMVELFRLLQGIFHLEQEVRRFQIGSEGSRRTEDILNIKAEIERRRKEVLEKLGGFLLLIWDRESRNLKRGTRRQVAQRLEATGLDLRAGRRELS